MRRWKSAAIFIAGPILVVACSSGGATSSSSGDDAGLPVNVGPDVDKGTGNNDLPAQTNTVPLVKLEDGGTTAVDPEAGTDVDVPPYATKVVSFTPGKCAGFGATKMPGIVLGPPMGGGDGKGGLDVVTLGKGGEIVLSFEPNELVDGPGIDLLVFENAFFADGATQPFAEPGEVSVSEDGVDWKTFPCTATKYPWGACAGWHSVSDINSTSLDPAKVGGDPFDLADVGLTKARFVRIVDKTVGQSCTSQGPNTYGFDLDAIAAVHSTRP